MEGAGGTKLPDGVSSAVSILNSLLTTAKIDVKVIEIVICKEEVVIGSPQIESYENELSPVEKRDGIEREARYLAAMTLVAEGRQVQVYIRFYLTSRGELKIEQCHSDNVTIIQKEEANKPELWKVAADAAERWGPIIIQIVLSLLGYFQK